LARLARLAENAVRNYDLQRAVELLRDIRALCVSDELAERSERTCPVPRCGSASAEATSE
jgi:hypothetical protein